MADIGSTLREARMRARIDISEVEASTKIRAKYLRAIENEEWDLLPGTVYVKSFLKTYGDYLGLDSRLLIDEFRRRYERPTDHELRPIASRSRERERERAGRGPRRPLVPRWAVIVLVLVAVGATLYVIGKSNPKSPTTPPPSATGTRSHKHHHKGTTTTPTTSNTTTTRTTVTTHTPPSSARVQITPTSAVWICVENESNKPLFPAGTFDPGQRVPVATGRILLVTLGNAAVDLKINGRHYPLSASSTAIGLRVTPTAITTLPAGTGPTCA